MKLFNKAVIVGTGLIGGSLGRAIREKKVVSRVVGLSRHKRNARLALKAGAIDRIGVSLDEVKDADLVILATPVDTIVDIALKISGKIKEGCVVIDVGGTKQEVVSRVSPVIPGFLGCHPLSGSEKRGAANLKKGIFENSLCIVTPTAGTKKNVLAKVRELWKKLGSRVVILSPGEHDRIIAFTSHLPHAVAFSLISCIPETLLTLSSGGLKDSTRISASDAGLWSGIFLSNRVNLLACLSAFQAKLASLKLALKKRDKKLLMKFLSNANTKREKLG
jgi:prephenate dehydrogenase